MTALSKMNCPFQIFIPQSTVGLGAANSIGDVVQSMGGIKAIIVTDPGVQRAGLLGTITAGLRASGIDYIVFDQCEPNAPIETIQQCMEKAEEGGCDIAIGLGGGSVMDTVKLMSLWISTGKHILEYIGVNKVEPHKNKMNKILIPTTAGSGSEWSQNAVFLNRSTGMKNSISSAFLMANRVIIDPELTANAPPSITAETGIDALTHALEAYTICKATLVSDMLAEQAIKLVSESLPAAYASGAQNMEARYNMALASSLGLAAAMSTGGGGVLVHGMAYPLRDLAALPVTHGASVSILMPHVMEFQLITNLQRFARIADLMGENTIGLPLSEAAIKAVDAFKKLSIFVGMPQRMREIGIEKNDISLLVDSMFELRSVHATSSCRPATREDVTRIYEAAW